MNPTQLITTGNQIVDASLMVLGGLGTLATILATILPSKWVLTQFFARVAGDLRNIRGSSGASSGTSGGAQ